MRYLLAAMLVVGSSVLPPGGAEASGKDPALFGAYNQIWHATIGAEHVSTWLARERDLESWQSRENAVMDFFAGTSVPDAKLVETLNAIWDENAVPMIAYNFGPSNSYNARVALGLEDLRVDALAKALKGFLSGPDGVYGTADDRRLFLRLDPEANGDWAPYSPNYRDPQWGHPSDLQFETNADMFQAKWRRIHGRFTRAGLDSTRLAWVYCVNYVDSWRWDSSTGGPVPIAERLYPGDAYVDWLAVDGYNGRSATTLSPDEVFDDMLGRLSQMSPDKPLAVGEVGASTMAAGVAGKSAWITDYFEWLENRGGASVRMTVWHNADEGDDYTIFGGQHGDTIYVGTGGTYNAYQQYKQELQRPWLVGPDPAYPRLITDQLFLGQ